MNAEAEKLKAGLDEFVSAASHDLREPLHKVIVFGDLLKERAADALDEKSLDYLARMQNAAERMSGMIDVLQKKAREALREAGDASS